MFRAAGIKLASAATSLIMAAIYAVALLLSGFPLGRMLRTVSIPRLGEHRLRTSLTTLGIALGVAVLVAVVIVSRSIVSGVTQTVDDLAGKADLQVGASATGFDEDLIETVRKVKGVSRVTPVMQQIVTLRSASGARDRVLLLGVDLLGTEDKYFRDYASTELEEIRRDPLPFLNSSTNLILSRQLADRVGLKVHDKVAIGSGGGVQQFEVWGLIEDEGVGRAFGGAIGVMYYPAMQVAFDRGHHVDRLDVAVEPGADANRVASALEDAVGPGFTIERPAMRGERIEKLLTAVRTALTMASLIALLTGAFLVFNTMSISIVQRRRELGILRALGTTRGQLLKLLTLEGAVLGVVGSAFGVGLGISISGLMLRLTSRAVNQVYLQQAASKIEVDVLLVAVAFALGIGAAVIATLLATSRAAGVRPVEALSAVAPASRPTSGQRVRAVVWGCVLSVAALGLLQLPAFNNRPVGSLAACIALTLAGRAFLPGFITLLLRSASFARERWFGVEARLASDNLPRDLQRTASTASGLMAGVSLTVAVATFIVSFFTSMATWAKQISPGDLFVTSGATVSGLSSRNTPMSDALREKLLAIDGVERARRVRVLDVNYHNSPVKLVATDVKELIGGDYFSPVDTTRPELEREMLNGAVVVSENFARLFQVRRGDTIRLGAEKGAVEFPVAGTIVNYTSDRGTIMIDRAAYVNAWNDTRVDTYELHLAKDKDPEAVRDAINAQLSDKHDLFVLTNREFRGEFVTAVDQIFMLMRVLEVVTLLVALLGMVTAILANVLDRVREIGVLRALGMLREQVRKMVVVESLLTGLIGASAGVTIGIGVGYILLRHIMAVQTGWYLPYHFPGNAILDVTLITLPVSAIAGLYPASQAAKLVVTDALDYE